MAASEEQITRLGRIEGKIDLMLDTHERFHHLFDSHDIRIRSLEKTRSRLFGWVAGVAGVFSFFKIGN